MSNVAIADNLAQVRERIAVAARRSGRTPEAITLVAVTKYVGLEEVETLVRCGCRDLGESRPQQLWQRAEALRAADARWHLVGHLQRNKVRRVLPYLWLIHSADSLPLIQTIDRAAGDLNRTVPVLLEVNVSGEPAKHGFAPDAVEPLLEPLAMLPHVAVRGLMAMAGMEGGVVRARRDFAKLRVLRDTLQKNCPAGIQLDELSMGMSGDFEAAIEEGATLVRIGSILFGDPNASAMP